MFFNVIAISDDEGTRLLLGRLEAASEQTALDIARSKFQNLKPQPKSINVEPACQETVPGAGSTSPPPTDQSPVQTAESESAVAIQEAIKKETEALDAGPWATTEEQRLIGRYARRRNQLASELDWLREQTAAMIRDLERQMEALDYIYQTPARLIIQKMLEGKKQRSIKTPWGTLGFRKYDGFIAIKDEKALLETAMGDPAMSGVAKAEWRISKSGLNEYFKTTGDVPPGCEAVPGGDKFYVK